MNAKSTRTTQFHPRRIAAVWGASLLLLACAASAAPCLAQGQSVQGTGSQPMASNDMSINAATDVSIERKLNAKIDLNNTFRDEDNKTVKIGEYFGARPVILMMPFYKCPGTCTAELNGLVDLFRQMKSKVGRDFDAVIVSIDPTERGDLATMKKKEYLNLLSQPGAGRGWHFLTGDEANIKKLADEIGYRYKYIVKTKQYAHPTGLMVLTPKGHVSQYYFGVGFDPRDVRLSLIAADDEKIGKPLEQVLLYCYHYDPQTGKYGLAIFRVLQLSGILTVLILGSFMLVNFRRDWRGGNTAASANKTAAGLVSLQNETTPASDTTGNREGGKRDV